MSVYLCNEGFVLHGAREALMGYAVCVYVLPGRCLSLSELELIY